MSVVVDGSTGVTFPDTSIQSVAKPTTPQSMIRVQSTNGYGSTNTKIRRYTNTTVNQGSDITYADSTTLGASFTINVSGVYAMAISDTGTTSSTIGISLNTTQPTVVISSLAASERLIHNTGNGTNPVSASVTIYLASGSVIRPHVDGTAANNNAYGDFTIVRVA